MKNVYNKDTAYFLDQDKTLIQVTVDEVNENGRTATFQRVMEVKPTEEFEEFLNQITIDEVEENTVRLMDAQIAEFKKNTEDLIERVKAEVMRDIVVPKATTAAAPAASLDVTSLFDPETVSSEDLFKVKLQVFEIEQVKDSKNRPLKAKIRKAKSLIEVLAYTSAILAAENE